MTQSFFKSMFSLSAITFLAIGGFLIIIEDVLATSTTLTSKEATTLAFTEGVVEKVLVDKPFINVATGDGDGAITYTSNDLGIATVNSSTGEVTIVGVGTTTITATQAESSTHEGASEDYFLIILPDPSIIAVPHILTESVLYLPHANPSAPDEIQANRAVLLNFLVNLISNLSTSATVPSNHVKKESFNKALRQGMNNSEVRRLQQFLVSQGGDIYPRGLITGHYGILTRQAVGRFQIAQGIVASESAAGYGVVGPQTRERINSILGY